MRGARKCSQRRKPPSLHKPYGTVLTACSWVKMTAGSDPSITSHVPYIDDRDSTYNTPYRISQIVHLHSSPAPLTPSAVVSILHFTTSIRTPSCRHVVRWLARWWQRRRPIHWLPWRLIVLPPISHPCSLQVLGSRYMQPRCQLQLLPRCTTRWRHTHTQQQPTQHRQQPLPITAAAATQPVG